MPTDLTSAAGAMTPRITISTRRFMPRPSLVRLFATGWYSANPAALSRDGSNPLRTMRSRTNSVARAVDNSQLEANWRLWIGTLSVSNRKTIRVR